MSPIPTPAQLNALLDVLSHSETYQEVEGFKSPRACSRYGFPFSKYDDGTPARYTEPSAFPVLQTLLKKAVLTFPPAQDVPVEFWSVRLQGILTKFANVELSESFDKGAMGTRKTLATAAAAVIEAAGRGCLGGCPGGPVGDLKEKSYNMNSAGDLEMAWDDAVRDLVYGNLAGELFDFAVDNQALDDHSPTVRAAIDWLIIQIAGFLHHVCVVSPDGPYMIKLLENVHKLAPYSLIRQTLRVGNAATMMNGMMKLLLAKMSIGGLTNFIGLTKNADDGMNLLQRIISAVLYWDSSDFKKSIDNIEKSKDGASKEQLDAIKNFVGRPRDDHEAARRTSGTQHQSIAIAVLDAEVADLTQSLSDDSHRQCLDYYSMLLSVRDREEIANCLCRQSPDLFTQALKEVVAAFDPLIRQLHDKIDLREHVADMEAFIGEFIRVGKGQTSSDTLGDAKSTCASPSTKVYAELLRRNKYMLYKWLHRVASQTPEIRDMFKQWVVGTLREFRNPAFENLTSERTTSGEAEAPTKSPQPDIPADAGALNTPLTTLFTALPSTTQATLLPLLDAHAAYLREAKRLSTARMQAILDGERPAARAPGVYLARWQHLMDETLITPATVRGKVRTGRDVRGARTPGKVGSGEGVEGVVVPEAEAMEVPDSRTVVECLGEGFRELLATRLARELPEDSKV